MTTKKQKGKPAKDRTEPTLRPGEKAETPKAEESLGADDGRLDETDEDLNSSELLDDDLTDPEDLLGDDVSDDDGEVGDEFDSEQTGGGTKRRSRTEWIDPSSSSRREDPVKTYLREIGKVPLLTKEGEVELAKAMELGAYAELSVAVLTGKEAAAELKKGENLGETRIRELEDLVEKGKEAGELLGSSSFGGKLSEELPKRPTREQLEVLVRQGRQARDRLTISNLRLVVSIAKRYMNRGLSFLDLIQEGNMGLMKAVEKFDYTRGYKFSTYATWWIRQAITRAIADQSRTIRVPVHMIETVRELNRVKREYIQSYGSAPTLEDLSELTGMSIDKIKKVESVSQYTASLERPIGDEDEDTLGDFIEDPSSPSPTKETFRMFLREQLSRALDQLDEREREILKLRYGLEDGHPRTLKDVSLKFNITRERVRQIEIKAIEKLKHPSRRAELKRFRELLLAEE